MKKRGYFFTLDAFIGLTILAVGMMLLFTSYSYEPYYEQPASLSQNIIDSLSQIRIYEINNEYVKGLIDSGTIKNTDNTALEQIAIFYVTNELALATQLTEAIISDSVSEQHDFNFKIEGNLIYGTPDIAEGSKVVASSKALVVGVISRTTMFGPLKAEVNVWQK